MWLSEGAAAVTLDLQAAAGQRRSSTMKRRRPFAT